MAKDDEKKANPSVSVPVDVLEVLIDQQRDVVRNTAGDPRGVAIRVLARLLELRGA